MPPVTVTALYAALLALLFVLLSARVIRRRGVAHISIGVEGDPTLARLVRVHANFAEYVPLALLLMLLAELSGYPRWLLHATGVLLVAARLLHAWGVSRTPENFRFRITAMAVTLTLIGGLALLLLAALASGRSFSG